MRHNGKVQPRQLKALRGFAAGSLAVFVALFAHVAGGGDEPSWLGVLAPWMLAVAVSTILAGRRLSTLRLILSVVASQGLFHVLFGLASPKPIAHHHADTAPMTMSYDSVVVSQVSSMSVAHVVAAIVTIAALLFAERALRGLLVLAQRVGQWVLRAIAAAPVLVDGHPRPLAVSSETASHHPRLVPTPRTLRGPPSLLAL